MHPLLLLTSREPFLIATAHIFSNLPAPRPWLHPIKIYGRGDLRMPDRGQHLIYA